jgi:hypothetical protein
MKMQTKTLTKLPAIGTRVKMVSENSNWIIGELGTVLGAINPNRVAIDFDGREDGDGYGADMDDFVKL